MNFTRIPTSFQWYFEILILKIPESAKGQMPGDSRQAKRDHQAGILTDDWKGAKPFQTPAEKLPVSLGEEEKAHGSTERTQNDTERSPSTRQEETPQEEPLSLSSSLWN